MTEHAKTFRNLDNYQDEIAKWVTHVFGRRQLVDVPLRAIRALEECAEANQSCYVPRDIAHRIIDQVYDKPREPVVGKEIGGSLFTMIALAESVGVLASTQLDRTIRDGWEPERIERIRQKNETKIFTPSLETLKNGEQS